ncbi:thermonuclease family protein [Aliiroseovarius sp.]|uniref:thermonuclease family protein n=1 Tax=Aliiroseovarius sp. TaxID=1872442 RepID=UPI00263049BC|nr:thermonuclease family protein [Aliiroseovarius sp.]
MVVELLVGVLIVALVLRKGIKLQKPPQRPARRPTPTGPPHRQPQPFDAASSNPTLTKPHLIGRAYVVDGDTIKIRKTQIRLFGIDAPEMNHPFGKKAKWELVALCKGQNVRAEITDRDDHGRTVARCYLEDGRDLSAEMVKAGLAIDWPKFSGGKYSHLEVTEARKKMWLADARQKGRIHVWDQFEAKQRARNANGQANG